MAGIEISSQLDAEAAFRPFARAVAIVTWWRDGSCGALPAAVISKAQATLPSLLVGVDLKAAASAPMAEGARFAINLLDLRQEHIARRCSHNAAGEVVLVADEWVADAAGAPVLTQARAAFACVSRGGHPLGGYAMFVGDVVQTVMNHDADPLIYCDERYGTFRPSTRQIM